MLAARLSADVQRNVLLLEAGPNFMPDSYRQSFRTRMSSVHLQNLEYDPYIH
jgi:choline dehydrogenase-like flavoprotein